MGKGYDDSHGGDEFFDDGDGLLEHESCIEHNALRLHCFYCTGTFQAVEGQGT